MKKRKKIGSFLPRKINYPWVSSLKSITERKNPQSGAPVFCDAPLVWLVLYLRYTGKLIS